MTNLFVLPASNKNNLYLDILYRPLQASYAVRPFSLLAIFGSLARRQKTIVHIHWEENVYGSRYAAVLLCRMGYRFLFLFLAKALSARFVWTMHNGGSHDSRHQRFNAWGRALMWRLAQGVIIQNKAAAQEEARAHPRTRVVYIAHPNYAGAYGEAEPGARASLRQKLGLGEEDVLLLALGAIRPYKRPEEAIRAVQAAQGAQPRLRLLIAGKGEPSYVAGLKAAAEGQGVVLEPRFVPDTEVPNYLAAADYALFTHGESSLTSGAVVLALSYGLPVIALAMPAGELVEEGVSGYAPQTHDELVALLKKLPNLPRLSREAAAVSVSEAAPNLVAQVMDKLYTEII